MLVRFEYNDVGELNAYLGCTIDLYMNDIVWIKLTQPVLLQSFEGKIDIDKIWKETITPAVVGSVLNLDIPEEEVLPKEKYYKYRTGRSKLLHVTRQSRSDI